MKNYRVEWTIDVSAEGPIGAARQARAIQQDPQSIATVFDVYEEDGNGEGMRVDLTEIDEAGATLDAALANRGADYLPNAGKGVESN